jgi:hypothetical protein
MFDGVPELDYMRDLRAGRVPANVELNEFYFRPGAMLGVPAAQQGYISSNYTHAARDMLGARRERGADHGGRARRALQPFLQSGPDAGRGAGCARGGAPCVVAGMVNRKLPFMTGDAEVGARLFSMCCWMRRAASTGCLARPTRPPIRRTTPSACMPRRW